jgi:hypothetical protein
VPQLIVHGVWKAGVMGERQVGADEDVERFVIGGCHAVLLAELEGDLKQQAHSVHYLSCKKSIWRVAKAINLVRIVRA